ncbi:TOBE domain-containing protein [Mycetohabitans sp. B8]|nr:TOBE domain-containing protein [Mycetohabitans sp. B8]
MFCRCRRVNRLAVQGASGPVDVETPFGIVTSGITTRSIDELDLKVGAEVLVQVKFTEVAIARL